MKYLSLFEKFESGLISQTISMLKKKGIDPNSFIHDIKKLIQLDTDIDKIKDSDFDYMRGKKARNFTAYPSDGSQYHSIKYWFSLSDGYMGSSLTLAGDPDFYEDMLIRYKDDILKIKKVLPKKLLLDVGDDIEREVSKKDCQKVTDEEYQEYIKKNDNLFKADWYNTAIRKFGKYDIITHGAEILEPNKELRYPCVFKYGRNYYPGELENVSGSWYLLTSTRLRTEGSNEETRELWNYYYKIVEGDTVMANGLDRIIVIDNNGTIKKRAKEKGIELVAARIGKTTKIHGLDKLDENIKAASKKSAAWRVLQSLKLGWTKLKMRNTDWGEDFIAWVYNDFAHLHISTDYHRMINDQGSLPDPKASRTKLVFGAGDDGLKGVTNRYYKVYMDTVLTAEDVKENFEKEMNASYRVGSGNITSNGKTDIEIDKADFCLILNFDSIGKSATTARKDGRRMAKKDALAFKSDDAIRKERNNKIRQMVIDQIGIKDSDFNNWKLNRVILKDLGEFALLNIISGRGHQSSKEFISEIKDLAFKFKSGWTDVSDTSAFEYMKRSVEDIYSNKTIYKKNPLISKKDKNPELYQYIKDCSDIIRDKIKNAETQDITDAFMIMQNIDKFNRVFNLPVGKYSLKKLNDLASSYAYDYLSDTRYYFENTKMDEELKENLESVKDMLQRYDFTI